MQRGLDVISSRASSLARFVESYSKLARLPQPRFETLNVGELVRRVASLETRLPVSVVAGPDVDDKVLENHIEEWNQYLRRTQDSLRTLAEETGGIAVVNQNDFDKALKRIDAETSDYYVLGYYSSNPDPLRKTRKIEVKARRDDVTVWSRTSYSLRPTPAAPAQR